MQSLTIISCILQPLWVSLFSVLRFFHLRLLLVAARRSAAAAPDRLHHARIRKLHNPVSYFTLCVCFPEFQKCTVFFNVSFRYAEIEEWCSECAEKCSFIDPTRLPPAGISFGFVPGHRPEPSGELPGARFSRWLSS